MYCRYQACGKINKLKGSANKGEVTACITGPKVDWVTLSVEARECWTADMFRAREGDSHHCGLGLGGMTVYTVQR